MHERHLVGKTAWTVHSFRASPPGKYVACTPAEKTASGRHGFVRQEARVISVVRPACGPSYRIRFHPKCEKCTYLFDAIGSSAPRQLRARKGVTVCYQRHCGQSGTPVACAKKREARHNRIHGRAGPVLFAAVSSTVCCLRQPTYVICHRSPPIRYGTIRPLRVATPSLRLCPLVDRHPRVRHTLARPQIMRKRGETQGPLRACPISHRITNPNSLTKTL